MEVIIQKTTKQAVDLTARLIADAVIARPSTVLGLATGRTMESVYDELGKMHREEGLDFSLCNHLT
jgi:glucosamine-6-phosphate deaminase